MGWIEVLLISLGVSIDALSVSLSGSFCDRTGKTFRNACRAALYFGGFQFLMPLAGFFAAGIFVDFVSSYGHWIAFFLLAFVGGKMIYDGWQKKKHPEETECKIFDFFAWKALFLPAVATSIDAFMIGSGIAFGGKPYLFPCLSMGIVTGLISFCGVFIGQRIARLGKSIFSEWLMLICGGSAILLVSLRFFSR